MEYSYETLHQRLRELSFLNPRLRIILTDERTDKKSDMFSEGGIDVYERQGLLGGAGSRTRVRKCLAGATTCVVGV